MENKLAIICLRSAKDFQSSEDLMQQTTQLVIECIRNGYEIVGFVAGQGTKSILKRIKALDRKIRFNHVIIYSPHMVAKEQAEYLEFVQELNEGFKAKVIYYRA